MIKINNRVYIFGGFQEGGVLNDMYSIDLMTLTWTPVKTEGPIPPARQGMASTRVGKKIYIVGGCDFHNKICYPDTYILDTDSLWWTKVENDKSELSGRDDFSLIFFRGSLYTFGGCEMYKQCFNDVFILNVNDICPVKCQNQGECKDEIGCVCNPGFSSHDCSEKVKCKDDCSKNGLCHNNAKCGCFPGFTGVVCNTIIPCPRNCTDFANGVCQIDSTCKCNAGFTGNDCSEYTIVGNNTRSEDDPFKALTMITAKKLKFICPNDCNNNGVCNEDGTCNCKEGFSGKDCSPPLKTRIQGDDDSDDDKTAGQNKTAKANSTDESSDEDANNSTSANATKLTDKAEVKVVKLYQMGKDNVSYVETTDCYNNCNKHGLCLNSTCFCDQGLTYDDCSMSYKDFMEMGFKFQDIQKFLIIAFAISFVGTLVIILMSKASRVIKSDPLDI